MFKKSDPDNEEAKPENKISFVEPAPKVRFFSRLRAYFLTGIVVTTPIAITIYLIWAFVSFVDANITPLIPARYNPETYLPFSVPGLGVLLSAIVLTLVGFFTANFLGRTLLSLGERIVSRLPIIRSIYNALKQIMETVMAQSSTFFREVVLIEYPRKGLWALAFVTSTARGEIRNISDDEVISVFMPTTPNPTSGFLLFMPRRDIIFLDMTVEAGIKLIISAGMIWPDELNEKVREKKAEREALTQHPASGKDGEGGSAASSA